MGAHHVRLQLLCGSELLQRLAHASAACVWHAGCHVHQHPDARAAVGLQRDGGALQPTLPSSNSPVQIMVLASVTTAGEIIGSVPQPWC